MSFRPRSPTNPPMSFPFQGARAVPSPCIGVCTLDEATVCQGCGRSIDEITRWRSMPDAERDAILARLARRTRA